MPRDALQERVLDVRYKDKNIHDVLQMTVREAITFFAAHPKVTAKLRVLDEVGLGLFAARAIGDDAFGRRGATVETGRASYAAGEHRHPIYF